MYRDGVEIDSMGNECRLCWDLLLTNKLTYEVTKKQKYLLTLFSVEILEF